MTYVSIHDGGFDAVSRKIARDGVPHVLSRNGTLNRAILASDKEKPRLPGAWRTFLPQLKIKDFHPGTPLYMSDRGRGFDTVLRKAIQEGLTAIFR